jgi:hypothetical protein
MTWPSYLGEKVEDSVQMVASDFSFEYLSHSGSFTVCRWDALPPGISPKELRALRLVDTKGRFRKRIPKVVRKCPSLEFLGVPIHLGQGVTPRTTPPSLRTLEFQREGKLRIDKAHVFPEVERVLAFQGWLNFSSKSFPRLRHLHTRLDRKARIVDILPEFPELDSLGLRPVRAETLDALGKLEGIRHLGLTSGHIESLDGIERCRQLESIWLRELPLLSDLSPLASLPQLDEVIVHRCPRLGVVEALLSVTSLRRLDMRNCNDEDGQIAALLARMTRERPEVEVVV